MQRPCRAKPRNSSNCKPTRRVVRICQKMNSVFRNDRAPGPPAPSCPPPGGRTTARPGSTACTRLDTSPIIAPSSRTKAARPGTPPESRTPDPVSAADDRTGRCRLPRINSPSKSPVVKPGDGQDLLDHALVAAQLERSEGDTHLGNTPHRRHRPATGARTTSPEWCGRSGR